MVWSANIEAFREANITVLQLTYSRCIMLGHTPRIQWRPNADGSVRTINEAIDIAHENGVIIPEDVEFYMDEWRSLDEHTTARGPKITKASGEVVGWEDMLNRFGKVPFVIRHDIMESDEAIVAVFAHEMYELQQLRPLLEKGRVTIEEFGAHTSPTNPGNFHFEAWDRADNLVESMRRQRNGH